MPSFPELDHITLASLRCSGATKWNRPDGAIGAFTAEMDYGIAPVITAALQAEVAAGRFGYLPPTFRTALRTALVPFLADRYGWDVPAERIHEISDVLVALQLTIRHYTPPDCKVIVPTPAYMPFLFVPPFMGREVIEVPMLYGDDGLFRLDIDGIDAAFAAGGGLLLMCNPHNPTGRVCTLDELKAVETVVAKHQGRVFSDEIWAPLTFPSRRHIPYAAIGEAAAAHTITAMSASKGWNLPGLKCAQFITSNDADEARFAKVGYLYTHGAANLGVVGNAVAYSQARDWLDDIRYYLAENARILRDVIEARMPQVRMPEPEGTYVAWLDFSAYDLDESPADFFTREAGVVLTDGLACGAVGKGCARFIFSMPRPIMLQALDQMATAMDARLGVH